MRRIDIDTHYCKGCRLCVELCPQDVLAVSGLRNTKGYPVAEVARPQNCTGCLRCEWICPDMAITIAGSENES